MAAERSCASSNVAQLADWDGERGTFWADHAERYEDGVAAYRSHLLAAAVIDATTTVLDIGCGSGQTTLDAASRATGGSALGVDLSSSMIELARRRAERAQLPGATFEQADAQIHPFPDAVFDVAISQHGSMFFGDPVAAFTNIARALRPGGRVVLVTWQPFERNEWLRSFSRALAAGREVAAPPSDVPGPFALSEPDRVRSLLSAAGFSDVRLTGLEEPMYYGPDPDDAFRFVSAQQAGRVGDLDAATRARALDELRADLAEHLTARGVFYDSAAWLIEARRP